MLKKFFAAALIAATVLIAGCGGGGSSSPAKSNLTKENVMELLLAGVKNSSNIRTADGGEARVSRHPNRARADEDENKYFDEWLGLWVKQQPGLIDQPELGSGELYFVDEALTESAGHQLTWVSEPGVYPVTGKHELILSAGNFAGERDLYEYSVNEDSSGTSKGEGNYPGVGSFKFQGRWDDAGISQFTERFSFVDGTWQDYTMAENEDLSYRLTIASSLGVKFTLDFKEDQSGTGRLEGPATGLPATLVWDIDGNGTITWSDGSTSAINIYEL